MFLHLSTNLSWTLYCPAAKAHGFLAGTSPIERFNNMPLVLGNFFSKILPQSHLSPSLTNILDGIFHAGLQRELKAS